jgi:hypothetical protein
VFAVAADGASGVCPAHISPVAGAAVRGSIESDHGAAAGARGGALDRRRDDPAAPAQIEMRLTLSGDVPALAGLSYRVSVDLALADRNPYVVGPLQAGTVDHPAAELSPVDRFRVAIGLFYHFGK